MSIGYDEAAAGSVFIVIDLAMRNPGDTIAYLGGAGFQVFDDNGVSHDPEYAIVDCRLENSVQVLPGGELTGCMVFEIPNTGHLSLVYAPYQNNRFGEDRYLGWEISYNQIQEPGALRPNVRVSGSSSYRPEFGDGWAYVYGERIVGEMQYTGNKPIAQLAIEIQLYDTQRRLIETLEGVSWMETILPGDKVIYWTDLESGALGISNIELIVSAKQADSNEGSGIYREFRMSEFNLQQTQTIWYEMSGYIENTGNQNVTGVGIHVIAYDRDGNIVGYDVAVASHETEELAPGSASPVEGSMRLFHPAGLEAVDHFEFLFESYRIGS